MAVELREVTVDNWLSCARLQVREEQRNFVEANALLMLQAKYESFWRPLAIYADDRLVGFVMYSGTPVPFTDEHWILQVMIDGDTQGKGYGRAALTQVLQALISKPDCKEIWLSCHPDNKHAIEMYLELGFELTPRTLDNEICMCRRVAALPLSR